MKEFLNKRNVINLLLLGIMVLAIPLTVKLARQQQILFSRAAEARIEFLTKEHGGTTVPNDPNNSSCVITRNNNKVTLCKDVKVRLVAPTGTDIKFQGRTQQGLISTVYAQATCSEGGETYNEGDYFRRCKQGTHCVYDLFQCGADDWKYQGEEEDCDRCSDTSGGVYSQSSYDNYSQSSYDSYSQSSYSTDTGGSKKGQLCEAGYDQIFEDGTVRHCTPGEYSDDNGTPELCKYDGDGDGAGPENTNCDKIVSCPAGQTLEGNDCKDTVGDTDLSSCWRAVLRGDLNKSQINDLCKQRTGNPNSECRQKVSDSTNIDGCTITAPAAAPVSDTGCPNGVKIGETACDKQGDNKQRKCGPGSTPDKPNWLDESCTDGSSCQGRACSGAGAVTKCYMCRNGVLGEADMSNCNEQNAKDCPTLTTGIERIVCKSDQRQPTASCPGGSPQKCFACRGNLWKYRGDNADATCTDDENSCTTTGTGTCKGPANKLNTACGGSAAPTITKYRVAQQANELESAQFKPYPGGAAGVIEDISFSDTTPGQNKCVFVQFQDSAENITERKNECITYVGPDPEIRGASCNLDITDGSLKFQVTGDNFGVRDPSNSHLAADNSNLEIREWANQKVVARMANPPDTTTGKTYGVTLTRADGTKDTASCSVNTTQISLGAKLFCRAPSSFDQDNVNLLIVQNALGVGTTVPSSGNFKAGDKVRETVTITKEGVISNLKTKLQEGVEYIVCVKAPKSLRLCTNKFTAVAGNNIITHRFDLPVGDVNDDEAINSADASICKAEWGPARAGRTKACEFNRDNVTNSFEWSCLLHDFNKPNQPEPI